MKRHYELPQQLFPAHLLPKLATGSSKIIAMLLFLVENRRLTALFSVSKKTH